MRDYSPITEFRGDYAFLSNFHINVPFTVFGHTFNSGEAAFQAAKGFYAMNPNDTEKYLERASAAHTPGLAKYAGRSFNIRVDAWDNEKVEVMRQVVEAKFMADPWLGSCLVNTGDRMLVEGNTWGDTFWGRCDGKGYNILGVLLMELRGHLK